MNVSVNMASAQAEPFLASVDLVVVDDDNLTLEIVDWIFRDTTTRFQLFHNQEAAMEYLSHNLPATLIVDYYMPQNNGLEFLTQLGERCALDASAVFVCSAIIPLQPQLDKLDRLGARLLDKSVLCDRQALRALLEPSFYLTGN